MACRSLRIDQLDAKVLDEEIQNIAEQSFDDVIFQLPVKIGRIFEKIRPEIKTSIEAILWTHRYFKGASPGQDLMDISYSNYEPKKIGAHFLIQIFIPYLSKRLVNLSGKFELMRLWEKVEACFELFSLIHLMGFLRNGGYSTIIESLLSLRNWNNNLPTISSINYDTQNRELIWHAFRDILILMFPLIKMTREHWEKAQKMRTTQTNDEFKCVICEKAPIIPMIGSKCEHVACYTCVVTNTIMKKCPMCDEKTSDENSMNFMAGSKCR